MIFCHPENDFYQMPVEPVISEDSQPMHVAVPFPHGTVRARLWKAHVGRIPLYLLDANVPENDPRKTEVKGRPRKSYGSPRKSTDVHGSPLRKMFTEVHHGSRRKSTDVERSIASIHTIRRNSFLFVRIISKGFQMICKELKASENTKKDLKRFWRVWDPA